jgi:small conductance mechanosensitive channel
VWTLLAAVAVCFVLAAPVSAAAEDRVSAGELEALAATIEDEAERKALVARIRALVAVHKGPAEAKPPESLGARFIATLSTKIKETSGEVMAGVDTLTDLPAMGAWLSKQVSEAEARDRWLTMLFGLAVVLALGLVGEYMARLLLIHPRRTLEGRDADTLMVRLPLLLARTVLDVVPIAAFAGAAYVVMPLTQPGAEAQVIALTFVNAYVIARGVLAVARMVLVPAVPSLRVLPLDGETATYLFIWVRRLVMVGVFGFFLAEAALLLGLPAGGHGGLLRLVGLMVVAMVIVFILQNRTAVARWIAGTGDPGGVRMGGLIRRFADVWHVLAILYVIGVFGVWALDVEGGFRFLLRATVATAVILGLARLATVGLRRAVERGFAVREEVKARFPLLEARANRYLPVVHLVLRWAVYIVAVLAFMEAWGVDAVAWLETPLGTRLIQGAFSIAVVTVVALLAWEMIDSGVERYLNRTDADGNVIERSARVRTLLPLLRNVVFVVLSVMVVLIVLSELGVNIAPLLAGAGVVGLAVGFGAQKLVQDVITGAFILFEDAIAVGDVVKVSGQAGLVEALSIRSIRLRDLSGSVHTIPFSSVDTVTNMTKEFSYYVFEVGVAYREDTDQVTGVLNEIGAGMQADADYGPFIIEPLEVLGVDKFADSAVVIKARFKTAPIKQWFVGREFNRRMKKRFDELGIEIPFPHTTVYFGEDRDGTAPPARIVSESAGPPRGSGPGKAKESGEAPAGVDIPTDSEAGVEEG